MLYTMRSKLAGVLVIAGFLGLSATSTVIATSKLWQDYQAKNPNTGALEINRAEYVEAIEPEASASANPSPIPKSSPRSSPAITEATPSGQSNPVEPVLNQTDASDVTESTQEQQRYIDTNSHKRKKEVK